MKIRIKKQTDIDGVEANIPLPEVSYRISKEFLDSVWGNITRHGIKIMADGRQWVLHCISGIPMERENAEPFKDNKGNIFWKKKGEILSIVDQLKQYSWNNPSQSKL